VAYVCLLQKTLICPRLTTILVWIWAAGELSASPHRIAILATCAPPTTVTGLRSFIGAYKVLGRVLPHSACHIGHLNDLVAGKQSQEMVVWSESSIKSFRDAQAALFQSNCPDLRRTHAHLKQGRCPSKELTKIRDVKRYMQVASIAEDNLLVVKRNDPL
jgi:hypothetical protein